MKGGGEKKKKKMSLDEYVDFFSSGKSTDFTVPYLNKIIHMHGFRKLYKSKKAVVEAAVEAMDLLDLSRSTLKQSAAVSSPPASASLTLDQVVTDIEALKWQECCLTSLQIIGADEVTPPKQKKPSNKRKIDMEKTKKKKNKKSIRAMNEAAAPLAISS